MINSAHASTRIWEHTRPELTNYVTRMVLRKDIAEEIVQQAGLRLIEADKRPPDESGTRAWLFRVASNLAIDHLRRYSTRHERIMAETKERAVADEEFMRVMQSMRGSTEESAMARDHLSVCFSCTLKLFPAQQAAALLLVEVFGFSVDETTDILGAKGMQVKNWIQAARADMQRRYAATCALINKQGVCHECVELSGFFTGQSENPLAGTPGDIDARLAILRERKESALGPWHTQLMKIVDNLLTR